ncbi:LacI family DNA-binding transcriptional regulator [Schleiferilactobacillus harbinensis]|uniref:Substrate-binding domain-containing protein n=1 Tax=Schleiferilactobacillus harbinensis TaxID=304207 RepID=A0A5P8M8S0_9LACO|nr:LacI family DNA-binding transcriptional regulator [Schleiferilactobacillus harbinensis]QFR24932.1 substrate-binding domain-containing protein [Schleiferilactobacillus harbinensis]
MAAAFLIAKKYFKGNACIIFLHMLFYDMENVFLSERRGRRVKPTTIRDVAKLAGVSISTVSKALNQSSAVTEKTRQKILAAAKQLNYVPNSMGKQLKSGRTKTIGYLTNSVSGPYFYALVDGIAKTADKYGYSLNIVLARGPEMVAHNLFGTMFDGLIVFAETVTRADIQQLVRRHIPAIFLDRQIATGSVGSITFDSYQAGYAVAQYLISLGNKNIGYIAGVIDNYDSDERQRGYIAALQEHHLPVTPAFILRANYDEAMAYNAVRKLMAGTAKTKPTAFIAANDVMAVGTIRAIQDLGQRVPADISVTGFDDAEMVRFFRPTLTTVHNPIEQQGVMAVEQLIQIISQKKTGSSETLNGELLIRESTNNSWANKDK